MKSLRTIVKILLLSAVVSKSLESVAQPTVTQIAAGGSHSLFIMSDGSLWGMGYNADGELGDGTTSNRGIPEQIVASGVAAISAGGQHSLFLKTDGSLWGMGGNVYGQLGDGAHTNRLYPELIVSSNVTAISAGSLHSLFLKTDGSLWGMGWNGQGELGDGTTNLQLIPEQLISGQVNKFSAGGGHNLFIKLQNKTTTELWGMGDETYGQLGNGVGCVLTNWYNISEVFTSIQTNLPVRIASFNSLHQSGFPFSAVSAGYQHSLLLKYDGSLWGMGDESYGQLGDGFNKTGFFPVPVATNRYEQILSSGVTAISAGGQHSLFIMNDGSLWGMGGNGAGQLGDGYVNDTNQPERIVSSNVVAVSAGGGHSLFLKSDGSLWGMGDNSAGQLGDGNVSLNYWRPVLIKIVAPPSMGIATFAGQPVLFFGTNTYTNYSLQMSTNLASGIWVAVTNAVPLSAVQIPNAPPNAAYFRLH